MDNTTLDRRINRWINEVAEYERLRAELELLQREYEGLRNSNENTNLLLLTDQYYFFFHQGIMGANRTALNRAIKEGKYELAEKLITSQSNPENLNDGSMTHALSTGKGLYRARPRNLRIVRLLLEKGASPNFRSPNVLDLPSVSAFEVAINYYLTLLKYQDST